MRDQSLNMLNMILRRSQTKRYKHIGFPKTMKWWLLLGSQTNPVAIELFSYVNTFFSLFH